MPTGHNAVFEPIAEDSDLLAREGQRIRVYDWQSGDWFWARFDDGFTTLVHRTELRDWNGQW